MEVLGQELAKEFRELRTKLGVRRLAAGRTTKLEGADEAMRQAVRDEVEQGEDLDLLWPPGQGAGGVGLGERVVQDLELETLIQALAIGGKREDQELIRRVLLDLCRDPEAIRYRQAICGDLVRSEALAEGIEGLLPRLDQLNVYSMGDPDMPELFQVAWWLGELETYVDCIRATVRIFAEAKHQPRSAGLCVLRDRAVQIEARDSFQTLARELPPLLARIRGVTSITIGVNLDQDLQPVAATLLSLNDEPFTEAPLLRLLLGNSGRGSVMPLHTTPMIGGGTTIRQPQRRASPMLVPLFRDLSRIMEQVGKPIAAALQAYIHVNRRWLVRIRPALAFYAGAARLARRLQQSGLPVCLPEILGEAERVCEVRDGYNINLALHHLDRGTVTQGDHIVLNTVSLDDEGRIVILTGPNRGGKTTYTQAIGLMQMLAQVGLFVPGSRARISPADGVFSHFPSEEELARGTGRFGDEAQRLRRIFEQATRHSLILLNESLSGTHAGESLYLSRDVVITLRTLGARVVFATHLHELAEQVDAINAEAAGDSRVVSLVSSHIDLATAEHSTDQMAARRSYRVSRSKPMGRSYALELARHYGISLAQLRQVLMDRGAIDVEEHNERDASGP